MTHGILKLSSLMLLLAALALGGCGANMAPVMNVSNAPVATGTGAPPSISQVRGAIVLALAARAWTIQAENGTRISAAVSAGGHSASVNIDYTATTYSISYLSSSPGLLYDGKEIHRRYNHWVERLRHAIGAELAKLDAGPVEAAPPAAAAADEPPAPPPATPPAPPAAAPAVPAAQKPPAPPPAH